MAKARRNGRSNSELRPIDIQVDFTKWAEGSVLCAFGDTRVLCNATIDERVPGWMRDQGRGWITAEYSMLPRATESRSRREAVAGKIGGRTHEISRLIGRALRASVDLRALGERTITLDCDVLQADGGTRTAAITGGFTALSLALHRLVKKGKLSQSPIRKAVAAVSLGVIRGDVLLDLDYVEDQDADTDLNLVMLEDGGFVEVQGTAEGAPLLREELDRMLEVGAEGIRTLLGHQQAALELAK